MGCLIRIEVQVKEGDGLLHPPASAVVVPYLPGPPVPLPEVRL
ncbi:MAG: hypothetical protein NZ653_07480 [Anaerolineae bacterium]|nr:hypothetical protein [Anaerolineae bacterium]